MAVPPTESWTSRAMMPLVSVTMAWASETPGVRTPPTVVKAPYFRTCRRLSGLAMSPLPGSGGLAWRINAGDSTVVPITHETPGFRVQSHEPARSGRRHLRPRGRAAPHAVRVPPVRLRPHHEDRGAVRLLHGPHHRLPGIRCVQATGGPDRPAGQRGQSPSPAGRAPARRDAAEAGPRAGAGRGDRPARRGLPPDARRPPRLDAAARGSRLQAGYPQRSRRALRPHSEDPGPARLRAPEQ